MKSKLLSLLSRKTSSGFFIPEIDGLRFLAIISVILFHLNGYMIERSTVMFLDHPSSSLLYYILSNGSFGVQLFFVISGFILAFPFGKYYFKDCARKIDLNHYFLRRITRIEPPYIINILILFLLTPQATNLSYKELLPNLFASLFYSHNIFLPDSRMINSVAWSLEIEVQFYIIMPIIAYLFGISNRFSRRIIIILISIVFQFFQYFKLVPPPITIMNYAQYFLIGLLLADIYIVDWKNMPNKYWFWDIIGLLMMILQMFIFSSTVLTVFFSPYIILILYMSVFQSKFINKVFTNIWVITIGGMCYTIYLWHYQIISLLGRFTKYLAFTKYYSVNILLQSIIIVPILLLICSLLFILWEKPFMIKSASHK